MLPKRKGFEAKLRHRGISIADPSPIRPPHPERVYPPAPEAIEDIQLSQNYQLLL